ncbi:Hypothetical predicted protein [Octopus vulgaris]|nr:Hypothetical predicted protein [Octopus vulgaris]
MTLDITDKYFNHHNKKMWFRKNIDSSNFKKPILTSTPLDVPSSKYFDDSGYVSPPCNTITPLNLNERFSQEPVSIEKFEVSLDHEYHQVPQNRLDWQEAEEEDVLGKKQLRRSLNAVSQKRVNTENITILGKSIDCSNIIGKRIGRKNCDIVSGLDQRNISAFLTELVGYLSPEDVHSIYYVSKRWQAVCGKIPQAQIKLKQFQATRRSAAIENKENYNRVCETNIQKSMTVTKSELFLQHAASLQNDQHLQKCPKCQYPAKVHPVADKGVCTNNVCNHQYCSKCLANYHGSASCVLIGVKRLPKEILNTRKAKKFLKRL